MNNNSDAFNFDFSQVDTSFGSGGGFLPVSDEKGWLVVLTGNNGWKPTGPTAKHPGMYLELTGVGQDAQVANQEFTLRFNLQSTDTGTMQMAYSQMAALGTVVGLPGKINSFSELFNKPFRVVSVKQKNNPDYTNLGPNGFRDVNGNPPGKKGAAPAPQQAAPLNIPAQQQQAAPAAAGGWPSQQQAAPQPAQQFQQAPIEQQPAPQQFQPAPQGFGQPQQFQPAPQGFGQPQQFGAPAPQGFGQPQQAQPEQGGGQPAWTQQPGR